MKTIKFRGALIKLRFSFLEGEYQADNIPRRLLEKLSFAEPYIRDDHYNMFEDMIFIETAFKCDAGNKFILYLQYQEEQELDEMKFRIRRFNRDKDNNQKAC